MKLKILLFRFVLVTFVFLSLSISTAQARTINSITLNGSSNATVSPSESLTAIINVTVSGNGVPDRWYSTRWQIGSETGCIEHNNYTGDNTFDESFSITVPAGFGTYDAEFTVYGKDNCDDNPAGTSRILIDAVVVVPTPPQALVSYRFNELLWTGAISEVLDSSGNDHHARAINGPSTAVVLPAVPGSPGTCRYGEFDGVDDYIALPSTFPDLVSDFTITAWIKTRDNTRSGQRILIDDQNNTQGFGFSLGDGGMGRVRFFSRSTNPIILDTPNVIENDRWYFVAAVADITNRIKRIYVYDQAGNQVSAESGNYSGNWGFDAGDASIGGENDASTETGSNFHFNGKIDEVHVYRQALDAAGITRILNETHPCPGACGSGEVIYGLPKMEVAAFTVINTYANPNPTTVNFTQSFDSPPLVFTLPTTQGGDTAAHRIRNVTSAGFQIMTVEPESEDGPHVAMGLNFLAIEPGIYVLPDGHRLEACSFETTLAQQSNGSDEWELIDFVSPFTQPPAVLGQVQTMNNEIGNIPSQPSIPWLTTAISSVAADSAKMALERSETVSGTLSMPERIAYLAAEPTVGRQFFDVSGQRIDYEILRTAEVVYGWGDCRVINYSRQWQNAGGSPLRPIPLASMNTRGGDAEAGEDDGGWFRRCPENLNNESTRLRLSVDEIRRGSYNRDGNRSKSVPERAGIFVFSDNFVTEAVRLDHLRFVHPTTGVVCAPSTIQLYACENSDCSIPYTGNVTANLNPSGANSRWSGPGLVADQVEFSGGFVELQLRHFQPGQITLNVSGTPTPANTRVCLTGGGLSDCRINFADAGFILDVPDLIANKPDGPVSLRAVKSDPSDPATCAPAFTGLRTVNFWSSYENPTSGTLPVGLAGTPIPTGLPGTPFNLNFDANAEVSLSEIHYADAGQLWLNARFEGSGEEVGLVLEGSDLFVSRPVGLTVLSTDTNAECVSGDHTCSVFRRAGEDFNLTVQAVAWTNDGDPDLNDNPITPNYRQNSIVLGQSLVAPAVGNLGSLAESAVDIIADGQAVIIQNISEVGAFRFSATPPANAYHGFTVASGSSDNIGRFIPHRFDVAFNNPVFDTACGSFTYAGQPFHYSTPPIMTISALNAIGGVTQNYTGDFWKLTNASLSGKSYVLAAGNLDTSLLPGTDPIITDSGGGTGTLAFSSGGGMAIMRNLPVAPFDAEISLQINVADSDGVAYPGNPAHFGQAASGQGISFSGSKEFRYGRLVLDNAYGPETQPLSIPVRMEYYNGSSFTLNELDNCTVYSSTELSPSSPINIGGGQTITSGSGTLISGQSNDVGTNSLLSLSAPGDGNDGSIYLEYDLSTAGLPWLQFDWEGDGSRLNPTAKATFGIFKGNPRLIYMRESVW